MPKVSLEVIEAAMEEFASREAQLYHFACLALDKFSKSVKSNERELFERIFEIGRDSASGTFVAKHINSFDCHASPEELKEIRLMALAFLYEIARLKINKKSAGF